MNLGDLVDLGQKGDELQGLTLDVDLSRLLETRMLVQANSGGGKSWLLRRLLEQTAAGVQQIVIDPEGEFATLREKFDYIIAAPKGADVVANPNTAALLARRLLETGVSAVLDIFDLKSGDRQLFVRRFLDGLINAPRKLWHPALVVIDEAHVFCPQAGKAEAAGAVIDICTRGRKRGLCAVLATQRLSKLHKDAAAEMLNKLIGRTGLDVDVKRAADELGMSTAIATPLLRGLDPGQFFAFGPALTTAVSRLQVGPVVTSHPQAGNRLMTPPPQPTKKVRESLAKLADLQTEAEEEARNIESMALELARMRRELAKAKRAGGGMSEDDVRRRVEAAVGDSAMYAEIARLNRELQAAKSVAWPERTKVTALVRQLGRLVGNDQELSGPAFKIDVRRLPVPLKKDPKWQETPAAVSGLRAGAVRILRELVVRMPAGYSRAQVGTLTGFSPKGGTFNTYLGDLRRGRFIEEHGGLVYATETGAAHLGTDVPKKPTSHDAVMAMWRKALRAGAYRMLEVIVEAGAGGIDRQAIADTVDMQKSGGTFNTYLGDLRRNGLITEAWGTAVANDILFPERS